MIEDKILKRIESHFKKKIKKIKNKKIKDVKEWDSLKHINIILDVEKNFNIKFSFNEITNFKTVMEIIKSAKKKIKK